MSTKKAVGVVEAKPDGSTLTGVEVQSEKVQHWFARQSPRSPAPALVSYTKAPALRRSSPTDSTRNLEVVWSSPSILLKTLARWLGVSGSSATDPYRIAEERRDYLAAHNLRYNLKGMPPLNASGLWPVQERAIRNLEESLAAGRQRALVQMATGSGKTFMACNQVYRLIKHAGARRVLFLVDRSNLGRQTLREFQGFTTPVEGRKFTELYNVQPL